MKNPIIRTASLSLMCLFALLLTACNTNTIHTSTSDVVPIPEKPNDLQMSEDLISGRIEAESSDERSEAEKDQALEQWLRKIPDDPGGLLRQKMINEYKRRGRENRKTKQVW